MKGAGSVLRVLPEAFEKVKEGLGRLTSTYYRSFANLTNGKEKLLWAKTILPPQTPYPNRRAALRRRTRHTLATSRKINVPKLDLNERAILKAFEHHFSYLKYHPRVVGQPPDDGRVELEPVRDAVPVREREQLLKLAHGVAVRAQQVCRK